MTQEELEFKIKEIKRIEDTRKWVLSSFMSFVRYFFKVSYGYKYKLNWHHIIIANLVDRVISGELKRLIINVPPGSGKSEQLSIMLLAYGFALNPKCRFLQLSASDDLILRNSRCIRNIMQSPEYLELFPYSALKAGAGAVTHWYTDEGGESKFSSTGSQVMGFRAGYLDTPMFSGCLIIDDPLKATEIHSKPYVNSANYNSEYAITTRLADDKVPVILIMQRLSRSDTTQHVIDQCPADWHEVNIPALIDNEYIDSLPDYTYFNKPLTDYINCEKPIDGRISYWEIKEPINKLLSVKNKNNFLFSAQYMQEPIMRGGNLIKSEWFNYYNELPKLKFRIMTADTAQKTKEHNDYSVFMHWGLSVDNKVYLINVLRGKWEAPQLKRSAITFWNKGQELNGTAYGEVRDFYIEDKVSGTGLIQELKDSGIPIKAYPKGKDKISEVNDILTYLENGYLYLLYGAPWLDDYITEHEDFNAEMTHAHDDQVDNTVMGVKKTIAGKASVWDTLY